MVEATTLTARQVRDSGLLHVINETLLWPFGAALVLLVEATCVPPSKVVEYPCEHGEDSGHTNIDTLGWLHLRTTDHPSSTDLDDFGHLDRHAAFVEWVGERIKTIR